MKVWVLFDTETTGLIEHRNRPLDRQPRVIELCALKVRVSDNGKEHEEIGLFNEMFSVSAPLDPVITRVTGIKDEDLKGKPSYAERWVAVDDFMGGADVWCAHNCSFDVDMLRIESARLGKSPSVPARLVCTVEQTEFLFGRRPKLGELHEYLFGEAHTGAHRALADVKALARCALELMRRGEMVA